VTESEKVIEDLKELQIYFRTMAGISTSKEGRQNHMKSARMIEDALALLKAQEPRVMDFDDVVGGDECWLEAINGACGYADCYACTGTGEVQVFRCKFDNPQYIMAGDYLKTWRCWTSRPTDERREAVKWE